MACEGVQEGQCDSDCNHTAAHISIEMIRVAVLH